MIISLSGTKVGVVNGLAVMDRGSASFGTPTVISCTASPGNEGIVNIEHEAGLSGEIHDKGLLILEGYLRKHYARTFPLSIYAGIAFEQSYAEVDGDSASSSELIALLSAIGELPVRQDIAVTGSVNQMGLIQPVGGINEKIEGFFRTCLATGLTGKQGVIIPKQNVRNLILPYEVLNAIKEKQFFIYPVSTIDEAMQLLTGRSVGVRNAKGNWSAGNFNFDIEDKLKRMYAAVTSNRG
jgi:predicted ATP-dependent protease